MRDQYREKNPVWNNGISFNEVTGYFTSLAPDHPFAWKNGRVLTHRLIYEQYLSGLAGEEVIIPPELDVHHKNERKDDNRIENLEILEHGKHTIGHNIVDMSNRICYSCKSNQTSKRKGSGRAEWRRHPTINGEFYCKPCAQQAANKALIICDDCHEERKKYAKGICERCYNRRTSESSPIIKCKGCNTKIHELTTNGDKREYCRTCKIKNKNRS